VAPTVPTTEASAATDAGPSNAPASSSSSSCTQGPGATRSLGVAVAAGLLGIALLGRRRRR
jgi:hypothetical protein